MENILNLANMEEVKQKIGVVIEKVIVAIKGDEDAMAVSVDCRKKWDKLRMESGNEQLGAFLEEELVLSMWHRDPYVTCSPIGQFECP